MKMSPHTPGPWVVGKMPGKLYSDSPQDAWYVRASGEYWIADICPFARKDQDDSETEANAMLIAAAPDLLKACRLAASLYDQLSLGTLESYEPLTPSDCSGIRIQLEDAIKKATASS